MSLKHSQRSRGQILRKRASDRHLALWVVAPRKMELLAGKAMLGAVVMPNWHIRQTAATAQVHSREWREWARLPLEA